MAGDGGIVVLLAEPKKKDDKHGHTEKATLDYIKEVIEVEPGFEAERFNVAAVLHTISFPAKREIVRSGPNRLTDYQRPSRRANNYL